MRKSMLIVTDIHKEERCIETYLAIVKLLSDNAFDYTIIIENSITKEYFSSTLATYSKDDLDIYLCGFDTDLHVVLCSNHLTELNYNVKVLTNYCNSRGGKASHTLAINTLKGLLGESSLIKQNCLF